MSEMRLYTRPGYLIVNRDELRPKEATSYNASSTRAGLFRLRGEAARKWSEEEQKQREIEKESRRGLFVR